ncbi:MAG: hypothetical protein ACI9NC_003053 [Verrucomicrobiales bacterium]|jgi:hypothetical protein
MRHWLPIFTLIISASAPAAPFDYHSVRGRQAVVATDGVIEGESLSLQKGSSVQNMSHYGSQWRGGAHLLWKGEIGQSMETSFRIERAGRYSVALQMTLAIDYGVFSVSLNGTELKTGVDLFSNKVSLSPIVELGEVDFAAGAQKLVCTLTGANPQAKTFGVKQYILGLDYLKVVDLDPPLESQPEKMIVHAPKFESVAASYKEMQPLLAKYCYHCHGEKGKVKGKVNLLNLKSKADFLADPELTRKLTEVLEFREMPPEDDPPPATDEYAKMRAVFSGILDEHLQTTHSLPPIVMRRMNRYEYNNAVRDLLELKGDIYPLPEKVIRSYRPYFDPASGRLPDSVHIGNRALGKNQIEQRLLSGVTPFAIDLQAEHGFNNRGDELSVSPILLESFVKLARSIVDSPEFDQYSGLTDLFFKAPTDNVSERLEPFLERAFRQPVDEKTLSRYSAFFERQRAAGMNFQSAMKGTVAAVLSSPRFIYLLERKVGEAGAKPLTPYELAARLSFFIWSSLPDAELLALARSGELGQPENYRKQVERLLLDPRSKAIAENFARQWLRLDRLITAVPDFERFEPYYSRIGCEQWKIGLQSMLEPLLLFESIMVEDRSIMLLVDSNYAYRSSELRTWYQPGKPFDGKANQNRFRTHDLTFTRQNLKSRREGGVITSAATLTMNSSPLRTNPITRGAWVAGVIFNKPPPPPPDDIPEIEKDDAKIEAAGQTLRQRLVQHQVNPSCVSCHQKIDPLGFALENFDAVGRWRDTYKSGLEIDASGELFGRAKFNDVVGLKDAILANPEWFMRAFCEHLLSYALGRELELADKPAVDKVLREVMAARGKFSTVVTEVATSYPFLHKSKVDP